MVGKRRSPLGPWDLPQAFPDLDMTTVSKHKTGDHAKGIVAATVSDDLLSPSIPRVTLCHKIASGGGEQTPWETAELQC